MVYTLHDKIKSKIDNIKDYYIITTKSHLIDDMLRLL